MLIKQRFDLKETLLIRIKELDKNNLYFFLTFLYEITQKYKSRNYLFNIYCNSLKKEINKNNLVNIISNHIKENYEFNLYCFFLHKSKSEYTPIYLNIKKDICDYIHKNKLSIYLEEEFLNENCFL